MKTYYAKTGEIQPSFRLINAEGKILGRLATQVATFLMGKHRPQYTPNALTGDFVVVTNAKLVRTTGNKEDQKLYKHYTGYPGGLRQKTLRKVRAEKPEFIIMEAVRKMLPKNRLGDKMLRRLRVYADSNYREKAQKLVEVK